MNKRSVQEVIPKMNLCSSNNVYKVKFVKNVTESIPLFCLSDAYL